MVGVTGEGTHRPGLPRSPGHRGVGARPVGMGHEPAFRAGATGPTATPQTELTMTLDTPATSSTDPTHRNGATSAKAQAGSTTDTGAPAPSDRNSLTIGAGRADRAARRALREPDGALQPRARPRAQRPRQGRRRVRHLRDHRGRLARTRKAALFQPGVDDRDARALLHRRRRAGLPRHLARPARLLAEVLHDRGQLRPRRQQHPGLLHPRHDEVPALHPQPEAPRRHRACATTTCSGTSGRLNPESAHQVTYLMGDRGIPHARGGT